MGKQVNPGASPASMPNHGGANMPANNVGTHATPLGTSHKSTFLTPGPASKSTSHPSGKPNMPAKNAPNSSVPLGTTKHGVGQVPGYLRGK